MQIPDNAFTLTDIGPVYDPAVLNALLRHNGMSASKGLGQHFLVSGPVVEAIIGAAEGCRGILEIGPGPGVLTQPLSRSADRLIALELDTRMRPLLGVSAPKAEVVEQDALKADLSAIFEGLPMPRALVSNMPYYITGPLLQRTADIAMYLDRAILMMQREVADRVMARAGSRERGSLSVFLQSRFRIDRLIEAPPGAFLPPPKVSSTVLVLRPRTETFSGAYYRIVRLGFAQPRKTLANNLATGLSIPRDPIIDEIESLGLSATVRAQELDEAVWIALADRLAC